ncbi:MAG: OmpA family protein [Mucilaginibacter polytrichastri]|nr:OmpA family protein [Mucilaginibacter polytrichastri]
MNKISFAAVFAALLFLSSCVSTRKYQGLLSERDSLLASLEEVQHKLDSLGVDYTKSRGDYDSRLNRLSGDLKDREKRLAEVEAALKRRDDANNALKARLQKALLGFRENGLTVDIKDGKVYVRLTDKLLFPSASIIIDDKGKAALAELAKVLNKETDLNIAVEGHTDDQRIVNLGQIKDNWDLSVLRATSVVRFLTTEQRVDAKRITASGKGEFYPVAMGSTPEDRSQNRRIEIILAPRLDEVYNLIK